MLAALVASAILAQQPAVNLDNGLGLLRACEDDYQQILCLGYIKGVTDTLDMYTFALERPGLYCAPDGVTMGDYRSIVIEDLRSRRDLWQTPAPVVVLQILRESFPCQATSDE